MSAPPPMYPSSPEIGELDEISAVVGDVLYLTNWRGAASLEQFERLGITHVAAIGAEFLHDEPIKEGLEYYRQDIVDDESAGAQMGQSLHDAAAFIQRAIKGGGRCLVHCAAGVSRSTTCVLAYLLICDRQPLRESLAQVMAVRRPVWPNDGFMRALIELEERTLGGPPSITMDEYVSWGDYEGPADEREATHHERTDEAGAGAGAAVACETRMPLNRDGRRELATRSSTGVQGKDHERGT
jgi:protein-tyrosine phosphatase